MSANSPTNSLWPRRQLAQLMAGASRVYAGTQHCRYTHLSEREKSPKVPGGQLENRLTNFEWDVE